jgi:RNA polymerase sigma-70 factor (ECF subfamily)
MAGLARARARFVTQWLAPVPSPDEAQDELAALVRAVNAGDSAALQTFFVSIVPHLLRVSRRVLGSSHPFVEDVAHEAAYTVVRQLPEYRGEGTVLGFSRRVALLTAMNMRRRDSAQKRARVRDAADADELATEARDPEEQAAGAAVVPLVRGLLDDLPEALAEAFGLNVLLGYTVQEIAQASRVPVETVRSRLRLAKQQLRARALAHPVLRDLAEGKP